MDCALEWGRVMVRSLLLVFPPSLAPPPTFSLREGGPGVMGLVVPWEREETCFEPAVRKERKDGHTLRVIQKKFEYMSEYLGEGETRLMLK